MQDVNSKLLNDITGFEIGSDNDALTFTDRLCRENKWSMPFARRCLEEYKKFIYLAAVSETPVTPSDEIDQVWHLHLTYTQSYWIDLCQSILEKPLHHGPTKGGSNESNKYKSQYRLTLDKYTEVFKENPPQDIWPDCQKRFRDADKFVRLNSADYFLLKRKPLVSLSTIATLPLFLAACVKSDVGVVGIALLVFLGASGFFLLYKFLSHRKKNNEEGGGGCGSALGGNGSDGDGGSGCSGCGGCGG